MIYHRNMEKITKSSTPIKGSVVTITGGKWTTYRKMAADAVENAAFTGKLPKVKCKTAEMSIGNLEERKNNLNAILKTDPALNAPLHPNYPYTKADIVFSATKK